MMLEASGRGKLRCHYIIMQKVLVRTEKASVPDILSERGLFVWVFY